MSDIQLKSDQEKASYGIGLQMGEQLKTMFEGPSLEATLAGLSHAFKDENKLISMESINDAFSNIQQKMQEKQIEEAKISAARDDAFLLENLKKEGVTVTDSGLQYEIITQGKGEVPIASSTVRTHYRGCLVDGTEFDSSYSRNEPTEFPVNGVIAGWTEALQLMPVGSKWKLYIPHQLAYGEQGAGGTIAPYSALIFELELLDIIA